MSNFLDSTLLLFLLFLFRNFWFILVLLFFIFLLLVLLFLVFLFFFIFFLFDFLINGLLNLKKNRIWDESGMLLDEISKTAFFEIFKLIILEEQRDTGSTRNTFAFLILTNCERITGSGFPDELNIIMMLGCDHDILSYKISRVETDTELTNHRNISASLYSFHECLSTRISDCTKIVNQVRFSHTNTCIAYM